MSAAEIIEQIKTLPRQEQWQVFQFVAEAISATDDVAIRYATDEQARNASVAVLRQYPEVFRRLAE